MEKVLIVDDNEEIRKQLKWGLGKEYNILLAKDGKEALSLFNKYQPKVITLDLGLPPFPNGTDEGFRCLDEILKTHSLTKVIVITGNDDRENALRAIQSGAYDFFQKPIELKELGVIINRALHLYTIEEENASLRVALDKKSMVMGEMIGQCAEMGEVFSTIRKIASSDVPVLIQGESGTGKELAAKAIHSMSLRKDQAFIPINCGAIPENLLESELFGHEKGSFTGAYAQVQGKFEYAHKGTLFLDEIGELPPHLQVKLLRFLQEKIIQRVGGREDISVDARIIAATNVDIAKSIQEGKFREDLFYRIGVIMIKLPPLRERNSDILLLSNLFLKRSSNEFSKKIKGFSATAIDHLQNYAWPGNVRELENRIQRAVLIAESSIIEPHDLNFAAKPAGQHAALDTENMTLREVKDKVEKNMIISAVEKHKGNVAKAANELGISRPTLYDLLKKHNIYSASLID
jgi:two-component system, NtrC family, response regulator